MRRLLATRHWPLVTRRAFTLIELLVVVAILAILLAVVLVGISRVTRSGGEIRSKGDLQSISTALEAYRQDFGDYPRVDGTNTGAAVLCKALIGPSAKPRATGPFKRGQFHRQSSSGTGTPYIALVDTNTFTVPSGPDAAVEWAVFSPRDGADGRFDNGANEFEGEVGFRVGAKTIDDTGEGTPDRPGGPVRPPYLAAEKFIRQAASGFMVDANDNPILYFPAAPGVKPATIQGYVSNDSNGNPPYDLANPKPMYDINDNIRFFAHTGETGATASLNAGARVRIMFGDYGLDGALNRQVGIDQNETDGADKVPYVLYIAGPDGLYGPPTGPGVKHPFTTTVGNEVEWKKNADAARNCDDVTNFR